MTPKTKKIVTIVSISAAIVLLGTGTFLIIRNMRRKQQEDEITLLLDIARKEGNIKEGDYQKFRRLMYIDQYQLPANIRQVWDRIRPMLQSAGNGLRSGYAVSSMQYFTDIRNIISTQSPSVKAAYNTVESLLAEAFKLNSATESTQQRLNSAKEKSISFWPSLLYLNPIGIAYNVSSGYTEKQWEQAKQKFDEYTSGLLQKNIQFNKKLLSQDLTTLKLFAESYKALSGGQDYFKYQKNPK